MTRKHSSLRHTFGPAAIPSEVFWPRKLSMLLTVMQLWSDEMPYRSWHNNTHLPFSSPHRCIGSQVAWKATDRFLKKYSGA